MNSEIDRVDGICQPPFIVAASRRVDMMTDEEPVIPRSPLASISERVANIFHSQELSWTAEEQTALPEYGIAMERQRERLLNWHLEQSMPHPIQSGRPAFLDFEASEEFLYDTEEDLEATESINSGEGSVINEESIFPSE